MRKVAWRHFLPSDPLQLTAPYIMVVVPRRQVVVRWIFASIPSRRLSSQLRVSFSLAFHLVSTRTPVAVGTTTPFPSFGPVSVCTSLPRN